MSVDTAAATEFSSAIRETCKHTCLYLHCQKKLSNHQVFVSLPQTMSLTCDALSAVSEDALYSQGSRNLI